MLLVIYVKCVKCKSVNKVYDKVNYENEEKLFFCHHCKYFLDASVDDEVPPPKGDVKDAVENIPMD
jgi:hypothetical protein